MGKSKTIEEIKIHKEQALSKLNNFLNSTILSAPKNVDLISYWLEDYITYLSRENTFQPTTLLKYKRGDIVKINFGYRVSSEFGGLHLGVVIDAKNSKESDTLTVVPLKSNKGKKLSKYEVDLGDFVYNQLIDKVNTKLQAIENDNSHIDIDDIEKTEEYHRYIINTLKMVTQIQKLKTGSIASVGQIITVSKIRI